jgi:1,4-dihydroxy-6-naphthoate synthase
MLIRIGHSADPDDAFMYWGLAAGAVDTRGFEFEPVIEDIETLNEWALEGRLEVSVISAATFPLVQDRYLLLPHGASMGSRQGPVVVGRRAYTREELCELEIAVPGVRTTSFLVLRMFLDRDFRYRVLPFEDIADAVREGRVDAGLVIHEPTPAEPGLVECVDLGEWWLLETGLPLPLGVNVARRDVGPDALADLSRVLRDSIATALEHRDEAIRYAMQYAGGLDADRADRLVATYADELTCDYGDEGRQAVEELYRRATAAGAYDRAVTPDFVE